MREETAALLRWYDSHRRSLPWRGVDDPYAVWVSETMLQQTRVETVLSHYPRFLAAFPSVKALAEAQESSVLKLWEGLGYYSRARNLMALAPERRLMMKEQTVRAADAPPEEKRDESDGANHCDGRIL